MIHDCSFEKIFVVKIGKLPTAEVNQVLFLANQLQRKFKFEYLNTELPLDDKYKLENGGFDLCGSVKESLSKKQFSKLPRPLIVITEEPFGDPENASEPGCFYFSSKEEDYDPAVTIMSIQPMELLPKHRTLQDYLLMMLSAYILCEFGGFSYHSDKRGCIFDYCDELKDMEFCFRVGSLCNDCEKRLQNLLRQNKITLETTSASLRLLNRSINKKYCFVAMPFDTKLNTVYDQVNSALIELGWSVKRADDIIFPRLITTRIIKEILVCDLVIADLSGFNPNVFYEVGLTHALGNDLLLLTQEANIPFDLKNEQTLFYKITELDKLKIQIKRHVGNSMN